MSDKPTENVPVEYDKGDYEKTDTTDTFGNPYEAPRHRFDPMTGQPIDQDTSDRLYQDTDDAPINYRQDEPASQKYMRQNAQGEWVEFDPDNPDDFEDDAEPVREFEKVTIVRRNADTGELEEIVRYRCEGDDMLYHSPDDYDVVAQLREAEENGVSESTARGVQGVNRTGRVNR